MWARGGKLFYDGSLLYNARILYEMGRAALDLRRLARYVVAFANLKGKAAILYSPMSRSGCQFNADVRRVWEALNFLGLPARFVTERQIEAGGLDNYKVLIAPATKFVTDEAFERIRNWVRRGGILFATPTSLRCDPWGRERREAQELFGLSFGKLRKLKESVEFPTPSVLSSPAWDGRLRAISFVEEARPLAAQVLARKGRRLLLAVRRLGKGKCYYLTTFLPPCDYAEALSAILLKAGALPPPRMETPEGKTAWGVEWRCATVGRERIVYLVNLNARPIILLLKGVRAGREAFDLISRERVRFPLTLSPLEVRLLRL